MKPKTYKTTTILIVLSLLFNAAPVQTATAADAAYGSISGLSNLVSQPLQTVENSMEPSISHFSSDNAGADKNQLQEKLDQSGRIAIFNEKSIHYLQETNNFKLALDPDNDTGWAVWPNSGRVTELPYNLALAQGIRDQLLTDGCTVDVILTRETTTPGQLSRNSRAQKAIDFEANMFITLAFNALSGEPWGYPSDGGVETWARNNHPDDDALANEFFTQITTFTGRPHRKPILHPSKYDEYNNLPSDMTYAHVEALYLDHNYDWPVIQTNFSLIKDAAYTAIRKQLEIRGVTCMGENGEVSPYPAPPSAEMLQRLRDLGFQNYQQYGADPVSFSTGNHVIRQEIFSLPGQGGLTFDFTLIYNNQDIRSKYFGIGWSAPISYVQRYSDDSVSVTFDDGRTYYFPLEGDGYLIPEDFTGEIVRTDTGWELTEINGTKFVFEETATGFGPVTSIQERHGNLLSYEYDFSDPIRPVLKSITDTSERKITFESNEDGLITQISLPDGRVFGFEYTNGNLTKIIDAKGGAYRYEYDSRNRIVREWDSADILFLQVEYDDRDRVVRQADAGGTELHLVYEPGVTKYTDNLGNTTEYHFDDQNRVTAVTDALGFSTLSEYDDQDNLKRFTDKRGNVFEYEYDVHSNLISEKGPDGYFVSYTYNDFGDLTSMTDQGGENGISRTIVFQVNVQGDVEQIVYPNGTIVQFSYDQFGNVESIVDQNGQMTSFVYDEVGLLVSQANQLGYVTLYGYDEGGRLIQMTDANGHVVNFEYDGNDNVLRIVDPKGKATTFIYDSNDNLVRMTDRRGGIWSYTYDDDLKLASETDPDGHITRYSYDLAYNLVGVTDPRGNVTRYAYNQRYDLIKEIAANGGITQFEYDASGNLSGIIDALDQKTLFEYNSRDLLVGQVDAHGGRTSFQYDMAGRLIQETGPRGAETYYSYDLLDQLVEIQDALGGVWGAEYDAIGNPVAVTDANGNTTRMEYDLTGQLVAYWDAAGNPTRFVFDRVGNLENVTNAINSTTLYAYDENDNIIQITDALGNSTSFSYDAEDNLIAVTDALGNLSRFEYNLDGMMTGMVEAGGQSSMFAYDQAHNLSSYINAKGNSWEFAYDALNQRAQEKDPLGNETSYAHDLLGRMIRATDANGVATAYDYDALSNLIAVTQNASSDNPNSHTNVITKYGYDQVGNLTSITDANGHVTSFIYDLLNQVTQERNALGNQWIYTYDPVGNLASRLDANGNKTEYTYTTNDLLSRVTYPDRSLTEYTYDAVGDQLSANASWLGVITNTYDALGHLASSTDHTGKAILYQYDAVGNQTRVTYPDGKALQYGYDSTNYLNQVVDPEGNTFQIIRDATHNTARVENPNDTLSVYRYDMAERLVSITNLHADNTLLDKSIYELDAVGNRIQKDFTHVIGQGKPLRTVSQYTYDPLYRLVHSSDSTDMYSTYTYDAVGNRTRLITNTDPTIGKQRERLVYEYAYNEINALTGMTQSSTWRDVSVIKTHMDAFIHDVQAQSGKGIETEAAKALSNMASDVIDQVNGGITSQQKLDNALEDLNQQVQTALDQGKIRNSGIANSLYAKITDGKNINNKSRPESFENFVFAYDPNGNRIERLMPDRQGSDGWMRTVYSYDFENRLTGTQDFRVNNPNSNANGNPGPESIMSFDAYGRLFERRHDQHLGGGGDIHITQFAYDGLDPIAEYDGPSGQYTNYYRGDGRILSMLANAGAGYAAGRAEYFHYDGLNSVTTLTKQNGQSAHGYLYSDFGTILDNNGRAQDASNFTDPHNHYTYTGQEWDENNGLYHFYAREYDPFTGTWLQQDPYRGQIDSPNSLHRFGYVENQPINYLDLLGFDRAKSTNSVKLISQMLSGTSPISLDALIGILKDKGISSNEIGSFITSLGGYTKKTLATSKMGVKALMYLDIVSKIDRRFSLGKIQNPKWFNSLVSNKSQRSLVLKARTFLGKLPTSFRNMSQKIKISQRIKILRNVKVTKAKQTSVALTFAISPFFEVQTSINQTKRLIKLETNNYTREIPFSRVVAYGFAGALDAASFGNVRSLAKSVTSPVPEFLIPKKYKKMYSDWSDNSSRWIDENINVYKVMGY
ncbi:MAG TPA: RHS repeat-associated core domain-containing protein [Anaerolineales bacterium]|nr:RHS repeat-associated core domain-containing protein [Anaerolineales bacterium]